MLDVKNLRISFHTRNGIQVAVENLNFSLEEGQVIGIVGESGSGKSVACYSLLGLVPTPPGKIESGRAEFFGKDLLTMSDTELQKIRGQQISMVFQDPMTSLNPYLTVGDQLDEVLVVHKKLNHADARKKSIEALKEMGIKDAETRINFYPHQFSGGMRQRVMIAMALLAEPKLLIADEPTTALDVSVQAQILELLKKLQQTRKLAIIFITHDLAVAAQMADTVIVMEKGRVVEQGATRDIFKNPKEPYTQKLLGSVLTTAKATAATQIKSDQSLLSVKNVSAVYEQFTGFFFKRLLNRNQVLQDISFDVYAGEVLGLVGESGSGKSTLGRCVMQLIEPGAGSIIFNGQELAQLSDQQLVSARRDFQMIFQDPYASLNPRATVFDCLSEPLLVHGLATEKNVLEKIYHLLDEVGLDQNAIKKYPHEFSGGQRQRIAIARAIALKPKLIVADEPVSALDVTVRAQILQLLLDLTQKHNLTLLFISHDLSVVRYLCDRVLVLQKGKIVEEGPTEKIFNSPQQTYTQELIAAIPTI